MYEFVDKTATQSGTPLNREAMMALQGFIAKTTRFLDDGSVLETNYKGQTRTTTVLSNGSIREVFSGEKTITKVTTFNDDGSISEVIS